MTRKLILGTALALMLGTATTSMIPAQAAKGAGKAGRAGKAGKGGKRERPMQAMTPDLLGKILGTPLTTEQTTAVKDANTAYAESIAKAVGLTVDELKAKATEYRKAHPGGKGAGKGAANTPATP